MTARQNLIKMVGKQLGLSNYTVVASAEKPVMIVSILRTTDSWHTELVTSIGDESHKIRCLPFFHQVELRNLVVGDLPFANLPCLSRQERGWPM